MTDESEQRQPVDDSNEGDERTEPPNEGGEPEESAVGEPASKADDGNDFGLSRRRILSGVAAIGVVGSLTSLGTRMTLSDASQFEENTIGADELDIGVAWEEYYNGDRVGTAGTCGASDRSGYVDSSAPAVELSGVEPGDSGELDVCLWASNVVETVWMRLRVTSVAENGVTETEAEAGDDVDSNVGELQEHLEVSVGVDTDCDGAREDDPLAQGSIADVGAGRLGTGVQLDPATPLCLVIEWNLPDTDSLPATILTDTVEFSVEFTAEQTGYTEPSNPWANS
jgi:hypothetical protein